MKNSFKTLTAVLLSAAVAVSSLVPAVPLRAEREAASLKEEETEEEEEEETEEESEEEIREEWEEVLLPDEVIPESEPGESPDQKPAEPEEEETGSPDQKPEEAEEETESPDQKPEEAEEETESPDQNPAMTEEQENAEPETGPWSESEPEGTEETESDPGKKSKPEEVKEQTGETEKEKKENGSDSDPEPEEPSAAGSTGEDPMNSEPSDEIWDFADGSASGIYWDSNSYVASDFRFTRVEKVPVIAEGSVNGVAVYSSEGDGKKIVSILPYFSAAYILKEEGDWLYVESGDVRGFVKKEDLAEKEYSKALIESIGEKHFPDGVMTCEKADNEAFLYTKTTVYDVVAEKEAAVCTIAGDIYEYPRTSSRAVGEAGSGTLAYILETTEDGWYFIESGDVRGFIPVSALVSGSIAEEIVKEVGENQIKKATALVDPGENRSLYYTLKSVETAATALGEEIAEYALSLVGVTEYVWGGTDLILGADCSGFTQSVYAAFGVTIPRLAQDQGAAGELIESLSEAQPGDIIYYASGPHVGIYIGNGQLVQCSGNSSNTASNPGKGATVSAADFMPVSAIRRYLIPDTDRTGSYGTDSTVYSESELELIWAIVAQEDAGSYEGALAVISSAMNRAESDEWSALGDNALSQLTAPGQYCYSNDLNWVPRLNGNVPDYVKQAVSDCLTGGIRNHTYTSFRSYYMSGSEQIGGGNYYFG